MAIFNRWGIAGRSAALIGLLTVIGFGVASIVIYERAESVVLDAAMAELRVSARRVGCRVDVAESGPVVEPIRRSGTAG